MERDRQQLGQAQNDASGNLLRSYLNYCNGTRTRLSLDKDAPFRARSRSLAAYSPARSSVKCIANTYGSNLQQAQLVISSE